MRALSSTEASDLTRAWRTLYDTGVAATFTRRHVEAMSVAHGSASFLPWHRLFLLEMEQALRSVVPGVALPYWAWGRDSADLAGSAVWGTSLFGGSVPGQCIPDGPFAGLSSTDGSCVTRGFTSRPGGIAPDTTVQTGSVAALNAERSWNLFSVVAEQHHGGLHNAVGGDMLAANSPDDPIFYAHHAYVDKWWADRQEGAAGPTQFGPTRDGVAASPADALPPMGQTVADTFSLPCVEYEDAEEDEAEQQEVPPDAEERIRARQAELTPALVAFAVSQGTPREQAVADRATAVQAIVDAALAGAIVF